MGFEGSQFGVLASGLSFTVVDFWALGSGLPSTLDPKPEA